jgi:sugar-specific transcriptional regulator TrmB
MTDFLDEKKKEIDARLRELKPLVDEYERLEKAATALGGVSAPSRRRRSSANGRRSSGSGRRGRPRGSGKRAAQAQELVSAKPGITIPELADTMGIQANYLYRVMPSLQKDGKVRKRGKGWHPA